MIERRKLLEKIAAIDFAIVELHLFLDTHPNDNAAATKLDEYKLRSKALTREYEAKYGPISARDRDANRWAWIANPWPWDTMSKEER